MATVNVMMSSVRLFEALKAEARRTGDRVLVQRWNDHAFALGRKLDAEAAARRAGVHPAAALGW